MADRRVQGLRLRILGLRAATADHRAFPHLVRDGYARVCNILANFSEGSKVAGQGPERCLTVPPH